ncbi:hypothetical protein SBRV1_gp51 [Sulfolobales Beppu rod-shaped virus 1]|uniref:Uncharacterized protein n=1 Tax=Sulfolobales Beppu rod-shaped virus 1 TaxID=2493121 RepID=A0A3Q8Q406_9VIRU|nr:hypothetical protein QIT32_gp51 [Sulfolobales Beppu rod-shaped virus 1]AZI75940.1 hypothetical protein SBRV1_gp51 [Sulfolobales Beppu rod-shaped virus 1]
MSKKLIVLNVLYYNFSEVIKQSNNVFLAKDPECKRYAVYKLSSDNRKIFYFHGFDYQRAYDKFILLTKRNSA